MLIPIVIFAAIQAPPATMQVVCHGDSLTWGASASRGQGEPGVAVEQSPDPASAATATTYPAALARLLGPAWRVRSVGTGGWPLDALAGEAPRKIDPLFDPSLKANVLIVFGGTNDLGGHRETVETAYERLRGYCRARKAAHPWRVLVVTPPVAAYPKVYPADFDAKMIRLGALVRQSWRAFADGIVDLQADDRLGMAGSERNPALFDPRDFTHLTDAGYALVARKAADAVKGLRPPTRP